MNDEALTLIRVLQVDIERLKELWPDIELRGKFDDFESAIGALFLSLYQINVFLEKRS